MRKGIRNFCNGDGSTSTLSQEKPISLAHDHEDKPPPSLEDMILQLEMEEELARKSKISAMRGGRMSSVNNSCDILRSARNALNQYPRFSLDGKDAMYRCSFRNFNQTPGRHSVCCNGREQIADYNQKKDVKLGMPARLAGENVVWCNPGVIGKLMGLDAMPIPINNTKERLLKSINMKRFQRHKMQERDHKIFSINNTRRMGCFSSSSSASSSINKNTFCVKNRY